MNKRIKILLISILLFALGTGVVNASVATATLSTSNQTVKPGETFTVTLTAKCDQGINGLESKIDYDKEKLEFVKVEVVDTTAWTNLGENLTVQILHASSETVKEAEIFKVTFKVKEDVTVESTARITVDDIVLDSDEGTTSISEIEAQAIEMKIVKESNNNDNSSDNNNGSNDNDSNNNDRDNNNGDNSNSSNNNDRDNNNGNNSNGSNNSDNNNNNNTNKNNVINNNNTNSIGKNNVDTTTTDKSYPKTGVVTILLPILITLAISIVLYKKYKEF